MVVNSEHHNSVGEVSAMLKVIKVDYKLNTKQLLPLQRKLGGHHFRNFVCSLTCNEIKQVCSPNQGAIQKLFS